MDTRISPANGAGSGFTLIEVLIAIVILSIGLLGLAGLQANSMKFNHIAYLRSQATLQAYDMADRMRANKAGVDADAYDNITAVPPSDPGCISTGCTAAAMAQHDAREWNLTNAIVLPSGSGTVVSDGGNPETFTITVSWQEQSKDGPVTQSFAMDFQP